MLHTLSIKKLGASRTITQGLLTTVFINIAVGYFRYKGPAISQNNKHNYVCDKTIIFCNKMCYIIQFVIKNTYKGESIGNGKPGKTDSSSVNREIPLWKLFIPEVQKTTSAPNSEPVQSISQLTFLRTLNNIILSFTYASKVVSLL
jgi:hypothetical protein